jgi:hypothetical protein
MIFHATLSAQSKVGTNHAIGVGSQVFHFQTTNQRWLFWLCVLLLL